MKNMLNYKLLIKVAIMIVVIALIGSQMMDTYAGRGKKKRGGGNSTSGGGRNDQEVCCDEILSKLDEINSKIDGECPDPGECPGAVPKTGQTTSFAPGDDGDLQRGVAWPNPRFTDNGDGTVTDNLTCLIWDKDANRFGPRTWSQALSDCYQLADNGGDLTDSSVAGDWHLANRNELTSLLTMEPSNSSVPDTAGTGPWSQGDPFNNVQSLYYWSATTNTSLTTHAWSVYFGNNSFVYNEFKDYSIFGWCVRGR